MKRLGFCFILTLGIFLTVFLGFSYSMWVMINSHDSVGVIETTNKCFDVELTSESDNIKLENAYPITDDAGSKLNPYSFKITNTCEWNAYYSVNLETLNKSTIYSKFMRVSLDNKNAKKLSEYEKTDEVLADGKESKTLRTGYLPVGGSVAFDLRIWLDYDTTVDDIKNDGTDKWSGKVVVVSNLAEDKEILAACQSKGGDLIDDGECRKYYGKVNNFVNISSKFSYKLIANSDGSFLASTEGLSYSGGSIGITFLEAPVKTHVYYYSINILSMVEKLGHNHNTILKFAHYTNKDGVETWPGIEHIYSLEELGRHTGIFSASSEKDSFYIESYDWVEWSFRDAMIIDLTLMFGDGNEPSQEWCDKYLTNYFEYNSEGTLTSIKEIGDPVKTSYYDTISLVN